MNALAKKYLSFAKSKKKDSIEKAASPEKKSSLKKEINFSFFSSVSFSIKKQTFFAKRLSFLIKSGVPMLESMHLIRKQTKSKAEIKIFNKIIADVANGQSLAVSLAKFKRTFGNFAINIIRSGETSGTLTQNLTYLADELKKKEMLRKKIMGAMMYPIIITVATFGITGFLTVYIFPKIMPIFQGLHAKLPWSTRVIMSFTNLLRNDWLWLLLGTAGIIFGLVMLVKKSVKARYLYDGLILRLPLAGNIAKNYNLTNTTRTLGLLLKSGISVNDALHITSDTTENMQYKKAYTDVAQGVMKGKNISELMVHHPTLFPAMLGHMVSIGEKSGNLSNTLVYLSEFYENEFEDQTKNLSSAIEPILMIVMGVMVGFVAISVITPIYEITNNLNR